MRYWLGSLFQRNAHSRARRAYFALLPRLFGVFSKRQSVRFVSINGQRYKRVVLGDSHEAEAVEKVLDMVLDKVPLQAAFPPLIHRHENELLLAFIDGRPFDPASAEDRDALAGFLGALYATARTGEDSGRLRRRLEVDADFLHSADLIDAGLRRALSRRADAVQPARIDRGLDYTDPVAKNFIVSSGRLVAVDVEALRDEIPVGTAVAKAAVHWLPEADVPAFIAAVAARGGGAIESQFPFVELCFRVGWTKRKLLQGRHRSIRVDLLEQLAHRDG